MVARPRLVGLYVVRAQDLPIFLDNVGLPWTVYPKPLCLFFTGVARVRIRFAGRGDFMEDGPNLVKVFFRSFSDIHRYSLFSL
jgi:hypothetical protein